MSANDRSPSPTNEWENNTKKVFRTGNYRELLRSLKHVMKIAFANNALGKDMFMVLLYLSVLIAKTAWSVHTAKVEGRMLKGLMDGNIHSTLRAMGEWFAGGVPMSLMNGAIRQLNQSLAFSLRSNLMRYTNQLYFKNDTYFHVNTSRDSSIRAADQLMTDDFNHWAQRLSNLVSFVLKPCLHIIVYTVLLYRTFGFKSQTTASLAIGCVGFGLQRLQPDFSALLAKRRLLEANLRQEHNQIREYAEEIALSKGGDREGSRVVGLSSYLVTFLQDSMYIQTKYFIIEDFIIKYVWSSVGLAQLAMLLHQRKANPDAWSVESVMFARRMLGKQSSSTQQIMRGLKSLQEFVWFTDKLSTELGEVERFAVEPMHTAVVPADVDPDVLLIVDNISLTLPTGRLLANNFSLQVRKGDKVLVMGPNGCGKSTLFRILRGLWVSEGGCIRVPNDMMFVPQRPYVANQCTFRQLISFPMDISNCSDAEIMRILETCLLQRVCELYGGLDSQHTWSEVLSGGEKQRLNLARVLYHKPNVVALDESTSAIDAQAEDTIFETLFKNKDMTVLTVSHRESLVHFHDRLVRFDGEGGFSITSSE